MRLARDRVVLGGWIAAIGGAIAFLIVVITAVWPPPETSPIAAKADPSEHPAARGTVADPENRLIPGARAYFEVYSPEGQLLTRLTLPVRNGWFYLDEDDIPAIAEGRATRIAAEGDRHLSGSVQIAITEKGTRVTPSQIDIRLLPFNPWLTLVVLMPAIYGLVLALLHLTALSGGLKVTQLYAVGIAVLWGAVMAVLITIYAQQGNALIPLFWSDLYISSGIIVFALIGCVTYIAFSLEEKQRDVLFGRNSPEKQRILQVLGGRVLIAPYVALAGYSIFAATFPNLNTGAFAALFGFFTGAWIKPVLQAINDIGLRLLSKEQQDKVLANALADKGPERPASSVGSLPPPSAAYLNAVASARQDLLRLNGVLGVADGVKVAGGAPLAEHAIVVYVEKKSDVLPSDPNFIPPTYRGFPTDVRELPGPSDNDDHCYAEMMSVSQEKIARMISFVALKGAPQTAPHLTKHDGVWLLIDDEQQLFTNNGMFALRKAYELVQPTIGDTFHFVAFVIDRGSGLPPQANFCYTVKSDANGVSITPLETWNSTTLLSAQVFTRAPRLRTALHEIVHTWAAYFDLGSVTGTTRPALRTQAQHWADFFDYGNSCLNESLNIWTPSGTTPGGALTATRVLSDSDRPVWGLCDVDKYLMGLIPKGKIDSFRFFDPVPLAGIHTALPPVPLSALPNRAPSPATIPREFRQTWVVVSASATPGQTLASEVAQKIPLYQQQFNAACSGLASLEIVNT